MASSPSIKIDGLLSMVTIRLGDNNFLKWSFQLEYVLQGYELFGHFDGSISQPPKFVILDEEGVTSQVIAGYKEWLKTDKALLSLLITTLSDEALEYAIGTKTARDAWLNLVDRYASVSQARINHLKTELQTAQKGGDSIVRYLLCLKHVRDQLAQAGVKVLDDDFMIARDSSILLKDFRAQLLAAEQTSETRLVPHSAMFMTSPSSYASVNAMGRPSNSGMGLLPIPSSLLVAYMGFYDRDCFALPSLDGNFGSRPVLGNNGGFSRFNDYQHHKVGNGERTRFWEDVWLGDRALGERFSRLLRISRKQNAKIIDICIDINFLPMSWDFGFRKNLREEEIEELSELLLRLEHVVLIQSRSDIRSWNLEPS